jgi:hypothetical protein
MRPAPQGRGYRVRKRSNHVTVVIDEKANSTAAAKALTQQNKLTKQKHGSKSKSDGNRLGIIRGWESQWFGSKKDYASKLMKTIKSAPTSMHVSTKAACKIVMNAHWQTDRNHPHLQARYHYR